MHDRPVANALAQTREVLGRRLRILINCQPLRRSLRLVDGGADQRRESHNLGIGWAQGTQPLQAGRRGYRIACIVGCGDYAQQNVLVLTKGQQHSSPFQLRCTEITLIKIQGA